MKWTPQTTLLVQCIGTGASVEEAKANLELSLDLMGSVYGTRQLHGYSGHPFSRISDGSNTIYQRYFDFAFIRTQGDPESVDIVNGEIEQ